MLPAPPWPPGHSPEGAPVFARNEGTVSIPPEQVWQLLIDATSWPQWYRNARKVVLDRGDRLGPGSSFRWTTFGLRVRSTVTAFEPHSFLAWDGRALGSSGYHRWLLEPTADGGTRVVTEEVQTGVSARLLGWWMRPGLLREHQHWISQLDHADVRGTR